MESFFVATGVVVVVYYAVKLLRFSRMLFPKLWFPVPKSFFTSMGEWAVVTGASQGIGKEYAFQLAQQGMNVVIISRSRADLDLVAKGISESTGKNVKVIVADLTKDDVFEEIEKELKDLNIGVLVNNVGMLPSFIPVQFLETAELEQTITKVISCNVKTMTKMCKIVLPNMESRQKGLIINISSGIATIPVPMFSLYAASKVYVERLSQCLQAEYKDKGIIIQVVSPFGVTTRMSAYSKNPATLAPEYFVKSSLQYVTAGDKTYGSVRHALMGWLLQSIPKKILHADALLYGLQDFVREKVTEANIKF